MAHVHPLHRAGTAHGVVHLVQAVARHGINPADTRSANRFDQSVGRFRSHDRLIVRYSGDPVQDRCHDAFSDGIRIADDRREPNAKPAIPTKGPPPDHEDAGIHPTDDNIGSQRRLRRFRMVRGGRSLRTDESAGTKAQCGLPRCKRRRRPHPITPPEKPTNRFRTRFYRPFAVKPSAETNRRFGPGRGGKRSKETQGKNSGLQSVRLTYPHRTSSSARRTGRVVPPLMGQSESETART